MNSLALKFLVGSFVSFAPSNVMGASAKFNYTTPELWQYMADSSCGGSKNSPIAIESKDCTMYGDYEMDHGDCTFSDMTFEVTDHSVNAVYKTGSTCRKPTLKIPKSAIDEVYTSLNVHIHMSSEHTIDGKYFAAEMHLVHLNPDKSRAAVVGTMIVPDSRTNHPIFQSYLDSWVSARSEIECGDCEVKARAFDPDVSVAPYKMIEYDSMYHYDGGLTTPPCSEIVWWNFADKPLHISVKQYSDLADIILKTKTTQEAADGTDTCELLTVASTSGSTSRPPQPLNGRFVDRICKKEKTSDWDYDNTGDWVNAYIPGQENQCGGMKNSPIALVDGDCTIRESYTMKDGDCTFGDIDFKITETGVKASYKSTSSCTKPVVQLPLSLGIPGDYTNANIHIHLSSEHTINGQYFAAELHMVHLNAKGDKAAVVGTMIKPNTGLVENAQFQQYLDMFKKARAKVECGPCNLDNPSGDAGAKILPYSMVSGSDFFHYEGGLTTPPCTEFVFWNFAVDPMYISVRQFSDLVDMILNTRVEKNGECKLLTLASEGGSTSRPPQALNGRKVEKVCSL